MDNLQHRIESFLEEQTLSPSEYHVLCTLMYSNLLPPLLADLAAGESEGAYMGSSSSSACLNAIRSLIQRNLIRLTTEQALSEIRVVLARDVAVGPVSGFPAEGEVDFTLEGASVTERLRREVFLWGNFVSWGAMLSSGNIVSFFNTKKQWVLSDIKEQDELVSKAEYICEPVSIGAWREKWWIRFPKGVRVDLRVTV